MQSQTPKEVESGTARRLALNRDDAMTVPICQSNTCIIASYWQMTSPLGWGGGGGEVDVFSKNKTSQKFSKHYDLNFSENSIIFNTFQHSGGPSGQVGNPH